METHKSFDAVKMMRDIRDKIDKDIEGMNPEELLEYIRKGSENYRKYISNRKNKPTVSN